MAGEICLASSPPLCGDLIAEHASARLVPASASVLPLAAAARPPVAESRQQVVEGLAEVVGEERVQDRIHATERKEGRHLSASQKRALWANE